MKKINLNFTIIFTFFLFFYFFPLFFIHLDFNYYQSLNKPFYAPTPTVMILIWSILLFLMTCFATIMMVTPSRVNTKPYTTLFIVNYCFVQLYPYLLFEVRQQLIIVINVVLITFTTLILIFMGKLINKIGSYLLIPLLIWSIFIAFLEVAILALNN